MGKIKVDEIEIESGSAVALNSPLKIKSYTAAQIAALTGMSNGELVYDSDNATLKVYKSSTSSWELVGGGVSDPLSIDTINESTTDAGVTVESVRMENGFMINSSTVASMDIAATDRAMLAGPVSITGTVNIASGGNLAIV